MARLEAGIYSILSGTTNLTTLIGGTSAPRIYPNLLPQDCALPALTYFRVSTLRHTGLGVDPGITEARIQVSAWSTVFSTVQSVADQVRIAMWRHTGTTGSVTFEDTFPDGETVLYDPGTETHEIAMDFFIMHRETSS